MSSNKPTVFVSSTCYDLKQIRQDLEHFLKDELGFEPLLSESDSFPVDPQLSTIENCTHNVDELADIFVLVIGRRYGMITSSGKSITNLEYLHAKQKNIPIYIFIDKQIMANLPFWRDNPNASFSSLVENPKIFEFVNSILTPENWCKSYEHADEIISNLRAQLAYLFREGLKVRSLLKQSNLSSNLRSLSGEALDVVLTKPEYWKIRLFSAVLSNCLEEFHNRRLDYVYNISDNPIMQLKSIDEVNEYVQRKTDQMNNLITNLATVFHKVINDAFINPETPDTADLIVYSARTIGNIYDSIIGWSLSFNEVSSKEILKNITASVARVCNPTLEDIEIFSRACAKRAQYLKENTFTETADDDEFAICLELRQPDTAAFETQMQYVKDNLHLLFQE